MIVQSETQLIYTGQISITVFSLFGFWRPLKLNNKWIINLYRIYTHLMIISQATLLFTLLVYFKDVSKNIDSFLLNLLYFFALFIIFIKQLTVIIKRNVIIDLQDRFLDKICQPRDSYEREILLKHSRICRLNGISFLVLFNVTVLTVLVTSLIKAALPIATWYPYSPLESKTSFCFTYFFQSITMIASACSSASMEGLVLTFVLQICAQLELLFHRLYLLPYLTKNIGSFSEVCVEEARYLADCTKHHIHIYLLGQQLNNLFGTVIFSQFFWSMIGICTAVYELTSLNATNSTYTIMLSTLASVLIQIFLYCFYGQIIIEKSTEVSLAVQKMDWTLLTNRTKKDLLIIMIRAARPIELHDYIVVVMSLKTFVKIVKSAYSAYNLMNNAF